MVIMTAAILGLLVLILVTGQFGKLFKTITGKEDCQIQFLVSSFTKTGGAQTVEPTCEPHLVTIDNNYLAANRGRAGKAISAYIENKEYSSKFSQNPTYVAFGEKFNKNSETEQNEWLIDEAFAKEMKYCWDITGRGKLDLFSNWQGMLQCSSGEKDSNGKDIFHPCNSDDYIKIQEAHSIASGVSGVVAGAHGLWNSGITVGVAEGFAGSISAPLFLEWMKGNVAQGVTKPPPTFCVLCARVKFSPEVQSSNINGNLGLWLANTPVTDGSTNLKVSYAQYIENDQFKGISMSDKSYAYDSSKTYAVVYARVNSYMYKKAYSAIASSISNDDKNKDIQMIKLVEYSKIKDECTLLVG